MKSTCDSAGVFLHISIFTEQENITQVKVYERTGDVAVCYHGRREAVIKILQRFSFALAEVPEHVLQSIWQPTTSALIHNSSTLLIGLGSMKNLIEKDRSDE